MVKAFAGNDESRIMFICSSCLEEEVQEEDTLCDNCVSFFAKEESRKEEINKMAVGKWKQNEIDSLSSDVIRELKEESEIENSEYFELYF